MAPNPPSRDEIERARIEILSSMIFGMERVGARANSLNNYNHVTGDPGYFTKDVQRYTATMAAHVQKNGLRGFLALPADIKEQGRVIGRTLGGGISGVATDVAQDMIAPDMSE